MSEAQPPVEAACAAMIRESLEEDLARLLMLGEFGLMAIDCENDYDLGRAFDQMAKVFLSATQSIEDLIEAQSRP